MIPLRASGTAQSARPRAEVWAAVDTVPAMTSLIGLVEQCLPIDGGWRWDLGHRGALGLNVQITFDVATTHVPMDEIRFEPIGEAKRWASGMGRILVHDDEAAGDGSCTRMDVTLDLDLELPLPRLLAAPIARIIQRDVQATVDDFLRRWTAQAGG